MNVFINGCFDLLHVGHVRFIQFAKQQGSRLTVGLNSDVSVRRAKGESRPIFPQAERMELLLACGVNNVILFDDATPSKVIDEVKPDRYVVGYNYSRCPLCEQVEQYGGQVIFAPYFGDISTTAIIERMRQL